LLYQKRGFRYRNWKINKTAVVNRQKDEVEIISWYEVALQFIKRLNKIKRKLNKIFSPSTILVLGENIIYR